MPSRARRSSRALSVCGLRFSSFFSIISRKEKALEVEVD
jgi:hypothetical protein